MFCRYILRDWYRTNFAINKYKECNRILTKLCIEYYNKYWKHRNLALHNEVKQRERIVEWYLKEKRNALESKFLQVKAFTIARPLNIETNSTKSLRK